ncbi:MAG: tRNA (adenine(22)-N(1))-methyltransferase TrmK, partial [Clostridia bacterium]|nr:tRNA (adenine(22)-N(1))-methyltransferase TrmK [Clostridia bacterium]
MDNRLTTLFNLAGEGETFCDVGCDHGLVSLKALESGKFKRVIIADISAKSLQKAQKLLAPYGDKVSSYVSDGFNSITEEFSVGFIAGMGGEEISLILSNAKFLPNKLVLGPQGHTE